VYGVSGENLLVNEDFGDLMKVLKILCVSYDGTVVQVHDDVVDQVGWNALILSQILYHFSDLTHGYFKVILAELIAGFGPAKRSKLLLAVDHCMQQAHRQHDFAEFLGKGAVRGEMWTANCQEVLFCVPFDIYGQLKAHLGALAGEIGWECL
jgi:hypothetical protein